MLTYTDREQGPHRRRDRYDRNEVAYFTVDLAESPIAGQVRFGSEIPVGHRFAGAGAGATMAEMKCRRSWMPVKSNGSCRGCSRKGVGGRKWWKVAKSGRYWLESVCNS